jgi:hypothetical protein
MLTWEELHGAWAPAIALHLGRNWLPRGFIARGLTHAGPNIEVDVATFQSENVSTIPLSNGGGVATLPKVWAPPQPLTTMPLAFPDTFEVKVFSTESGRKLVAAIELVSPGNKDREDKRRAFLSKCASYLHEGISLLVVNLVTDRHHNLHNELISWLQGPETAILPPKEHLFAVAYRPVVRDELTQLDVWIERCAVGSPLPTMPLRLTGDLFVPVELETTYLDICQGYGVI